MLGIEYLSDPYRSDLEEAKLWLFLFLGPLGLTAKTVQIFTSHASQTHITIHIPKAQDTYYPLTPPWRPRDDNDKDTRKDKDKDKDRTFKKTEWLKDPTCAIFLKMVWLEDNKYDDGGWTEGDDNDKDTGKDKDKDKDRDKDEMTKDPTCAIFLKMIWLKDIKYDDGGWISDASLKVMHRRWWCIAGGDAPQVVRHHAPW